MAETRAQEQREQVKSFIKEFYTIINSSSSLNINNHDDQIDVEDIVSDEIVTTVIDFYSHIFTLRKLIDTMEDKPESIFFFFNSLKLVNEVLEKEINRINGTIRMVEIWAGKNIEVPLVTKPTGDKIYEYAPTNKDEYYY